MNRYWNATDHSVTVDDEGHGLGGGEYVDMEATPELERAVRLGLILDQGEAPGQGASAPVETTASDTSAASDETKQTSETLSTSAKRQKSTRKNEEN